MEILLIGAGNMGGAMLQGWHNFHVTVIESDLTKQEMLQTLHPHVNVITSDVICIEGKSVILAIKPQVFPSLRFEGTANHVISIMAGVTLDQLKTHCSSQTYIRAMPNLAAMNGKSVTTFTGDIIAKEIALTILESIGRCVWVNNEKELDIATALSGSGPAYLALVAESLEDGAVRMGLNRESAHALTQGLFEGFSSLLFDYDAPTIKNKTMSPGGTTAAGYYALESHSTRCAFMNAIEAALLQAQALGHKK